MKEYASIETIFVRDPLTHALALGEIRVEAAQSVGSWVITEKVDGMNIRAIFTLDPGPLAAGGFEPYLKLRVMGRTDNAHLPPGVEDAVKRAFSEEGRAFIQALWGREFAKGMAVTFYGEAFGEGIQKNPLRLAGKRFRVFDILIGERVWLDDANVQGLADSIGYLPVPLIGLINRIPRDETELLQLAGTSKIATENIRPEGIVARPQVPLFDTYGNRVIWKLTFREFDKLRAQAEAQRVAEIEARTPPVQEPMTMQGEDGLSLSGSGVVDHGHGY